MKTLGARVLTRSCPKSKFKTSTGVSGITRPSRISYWAIESGIADPVKAALELGRFPPMDVVGQVVPYWTGSSGDDPRHGPARGEHGVFRGYYPSRRGS